MRWLQSQPRVVPDLVRVEDQSRYPPLRTRTSGHRRTDHACGLLFGMGAALQGIFWWEIDVTYCGPGALSMLGIVWDPRSLPAGAPTVEDRELPNARL